jgi:predicted GIY-YIG superfamily endonuclease
MEKGEHKLFGRSQPLTFLMMKYYFYILECNSGERYYGQTNNLSRRVEEHAKGRVVSTRRKRPIRLVYHEEFID